MEGIGYKLLAAFSVMLALAYTGCEEKARLYNLTTGEVIPATFTWGGSGRGQINAVSKSGENLQGEYLTFAKPPVNWGNVYAAVYGTGGAAYGGAPSGSHQYGSAVVTGDQGTVCDCEYVTGAVSPHGSGACTDNRGNQYKLMF
jgi:hypothetical protein